MIEKIIYQAKKHKDKPAIWINQQYYSYQELLQQSMDYAQAIFRFSGSEKCCAFFGDKTLHSYQLILASHLSGNAYLALPPKTSVDGITKIIQQAAPEIICLPTTFHKNLHTIIHVLNQIQPLSIIAFSKDTYDFVKSNLPENHDLHYFDQSSLDKAQEFYIPTLDNHAAYIMFTSGTTGVPKKIKISHHNLATYVEAICSLFTPSHHDRFTQISEQTFDLSVHDMFVCWSVGGTLFVIPEHSILSISKIISQYQLTYWLAVPSIINLLKNYGGLKDGKLNSLKYSFFCGETLSNHHALLWNSIAPNSKIVNLYGPTEATIAVTYHLWNPEATHHHNVPLGNPLSPLTSLSLEKNELCIAGDQLAEDFKPLYHTGDHVKLDEKVGYIFCGRNDDQWKIRGYRIEKLEIEHEYKKITGLACVCAVPIQYSEIFDGFALFMTGPVDLEKTLIQAKKILPSIMLPNIMIELESIPLTSHGKIDYATLKQLIHKPDQWISSYEK